MTTEKVFAYHYTLGSNYLSMRNGRAYGESGLLPIRHFVNYCVVTGLPDEAYDYVVEALLEPEPTLWKNSSEFPYTWSTLMSTICREENILLLKFEITHNDRAYVVDRAHVERSLGHSLWNSEQPTRENLNDGYRKYFESRVPALEYRGGFSLPQLVIWTPINFDRLSVEWERPHTEVMRSSCDL